MRIMLLIFFAIISCHSEKESTDEVVAQKIPTSKGDSVHQTTSNSAIEDVGNKGQQVIERYYPEEKGIIRFDTIFSERELKISIESKFLETFVIDKYESDGILYIDKYRDSEKHLTIALTNEVVIDTVFRKNDLLKYVGPEFLNIAIFHGFWLDNISKDTIIFFAVISKPETDWSYLFHYEFDIESRSITINEKRTNDLIPQPNEIENDLTAQQNADSLLKFIEDDDQERFFQFFPNSFNEMEELFGFSDSTGMAPLYENGNKVILYFQNLDQIRMDDYIEKYIRINIGGTWQADNIQQGFGIYDQVIKHPDLAINSLLKFDDEEILSVFEFLFDGPHPDNDQNREKIQKLKQLFRGHSKLIELIEQAFKNVLTLAEHSH